MTRKRIILAIACLHLLQLYDTVASEKRVIVKKKDIEKISDAAKPIIDERYTKLAAVFDDRPNISDLQRANLVMTRTISAIQILTNSDALFKKEIKDALKAVDTLKYNDHIKKIVVNSLARTAIKKLTLLAKEHIRNEGLNR